jgi:hypothetical protein
LNVTVPSAAPEEGVAAETLAVNLTTCPDLAGLGATVSAETRFKTELARNLHLDILYQNGYNN